MRAPGLVLLVLLGCSYLPRGSDDTARTLAVHQPPGRWQDATAHRLEEVGASDWCADAARYVDRGNFTDHVARVRDLDGGAPVRLGRQDWIEHVHWSADCTAVAYVTGDERVKAWDLAPLRRLPTLRGDGYDHEEGRDSYHAWVMPHARAVLAPARHDGRGRPLPPLRDRAGAAPSPYGLGVSFDGRYFTDGSDVWDADGTWRCNLDDGGSRPGLAVADPHVFVGDDGLWSLDDCRRHATLPEAARGGELSPDGARVAYLTGDGFAVLEVATQRVLMRRPAPLDPWLGGTLGWSNDGRVLIAANDFGAVEVVDAATGTQLASWHVDDIFVDLRILASARRIVVADHGSSWSWELPTDAAPRR
ncbi:MAG: hypothetical protein IT370_22865 [Deltaproteobacteria bacterium]|nr:hypothetical protein [Deltaproteobacteria bacterium]